MEKPQSKTVADILLEDYIIVLEPKDFGKPLALLRKLQSRLPSGKVPEDLYTKVENLAKEDNPAKKQAQIIQALLNNMHVLAQTMETAASKGQAFSEEGRKFQELWAARNTPLGPEALVQEIQGTYSQKVLKTLNELMEVSKAELSSVQRRELTKVLESICLPTGGEHENILHHRLVQKNYEMDRRIHASLHPQIPKAPLEKRYIAKEVEETLLDCNEVRKRHRDKVQEIKKLEQTIQELEQKIALLKKPAQTPSIWGRIGLGASPQKPSTEQLTQEKDLVTKKSKLDSLMDEKSKLEGAIRDYTHDLLQMVTRVENWPEDKEWIRKGNLHALPILS